MEIWISEPQIWPDKDQAKAVLEFNTIALWLLGLQCTNLYYAMQVSLGKYADDAIQEEYVAVEEIDEFWTGEFWWPDYRHLHR